MATPARSRRSRTVTVPGPHNDKQVADRELWAEGRKRIAEAAKPRRVPINATEAHPDALQAQAEERIPVGA